jgi:AcrR family transcriptional regulator
VAYPAYVREKARELRAEKHLSVDEIAERLALPKTTIYYWVRDLPLGRPRRGSAGQRKGNRNMQRNYAVRRAAAYLLGRIEFSDLLAEPTFRDFVCLYMAEGYKRSRNTVSVCNSDPAIVVLCARWVRRFARNPVKYSVQYHADQDLQVLRDFWAHTIGVAPADIRLQRKSNSGRLSGRTWRSKYGVLQVYAGDTLFHARLEAWMHSLQEQWLDSASAGRGAAW